MFCLHKTKFRSSETVYTIRLHGSRILEPVLSELASPTIPLKGAKDELDLYIKYVSSVQICFKYPYQGLLTVMCVMEQAWARATPDSLLYAPFCCLTIPPSSCGVTNLQSTMVWGHLILLALLKQVQVITSTGDLVKSIVESNMGDEWMG